MKSINNVKGKGLRAFSLPKVLTLVFAFSLSALDSYALIASVPDGHLPEAADSVENYAFDLLEPSVASYVPNALKKVKHISTEADVLMAQKEASKTYSLKSVSRAGAAAADDTDYSVGQIPINESVTPSGGRIYSIGIHVAGGWPAAPQAALCYNSQAGNGVAGYGWNIGGIPSIEIRNRNYYYDGKIQHSIYDSEDAAYSLDGVPIVASSLNMGDYTYATARGNIQLKKHFTSSGVLSYFTALYPDGSKGTFGFTDNSSYRTTYPLTRMEDINGNIINYYYNCSGCHYYIERIDYGADAGVVFRYESRSDSGSYKYYSGLGDWYPSKRISAIFSLDGDVEICRYTLEYEYKDKVSLLRKINCISGNVAYRPLSFTYGVDTEEYIDESFRLREQNFFMKYFTQTDDVDILYKRGKFIPGGFNDGIVMLPHYSNHDKLDSKLHWFTRYYKYGSRYSKDQTIICNPSAVESSMQFEIKAGAGFQTIEALDVNGDGTDELVKINYGCTVQDKTDFKIYIYSFDRYGTASCDSLSFRVNDGTHNPCYNNPARCDYYFGNFRGTGKQMLVIATRNKSRFVLVDLASKQVVSETGLVKMSEEVAGFILATDFENDGQDDLCHITDNGMDVYSLSPIIGTTFTKRTTYSGVSKSQLLSNPGYADDGLLGSPYLLDINGDGYIDIAYVLGVAKENNTIYPSSGWNISFFDGKSFDTLNRQLTLRLDRDKYVFMDVDKDGLPDMLQWRKHEIILVPNVNGEFFPQSSYVKINIEENAELVPCDISAYGVTGDIMTVSGPYINVYAYNTNHGTNRLLTQFEDSFGVQHYNSYGNISRNDASYQTDFTRPYNASSGFVRQRVPLAVLFGERTMAGGKTVANNYYTYYDAVFNTRGLGFCGFGKTRCIDYVNGYVTVSEQDPEKLGVQTRITKTLQSPGSLPFAEVVNTYDNHFTTYGKLNPRLTASESSDRLSGVVTKTEIKYDDYDYPTLTTISKTSDSGTKYTENQSNKYEHNIVADKYVLGAVKEKSVSRNSGSLRRNPSWIEKSVLTYDERYRPLTRKDYVGSDSPDIITIRPDLPVIDTTLVRPLKSRAHFPDTLFIPTDTSRVSEPVGPVDSIYRPRLDFDATIYLVSETKWEYDTYGNVISEKSAPYGATEFTGSTYAYDGTGRYLRSSVNPLGQTTVYSDYNKFGKPERVTDYRGRTTSYTYDEWGNLIKTEHPDGMIEETVAAWGGQGLYTVEKTTTGKPATIAHFDVLGREIRSGNQRFYGQWQYVDKVYDGKGRLQKESLPFRSGSATYWNEIEYDDYGRKVKVTEASGKVSTWAYNGTSVTSSQNGMESTKTYDANGNLISVSDAGGMVTYILRNDGQPSKVSVTGGSYMEFGYDKYGRRTKIVDPSAGTQTDSLAFNIDGSSVSIHTNPNGSIITYVDKYGRATKVERPGEYTTDYVYNSDGLLISEVSSNGTSKAYTYDEFDRVSTLKEIVPDGKWLKKSYTYTSGSNVSSVAYESQNGAIATENFAYANGTNIRIGLQATHVRLINGENEFGQPTSVVTGSVNRSYSYNAFGIPTRRTMGDMMDCSYTFDPLTGNLLNRTDNLRNLTESFGYDELNRLTAIGDRTISYAANGNITSMDSVGEMTYGSSSKPYQLTSLTLEEDVVPSRVQNISYTCYSRPSIMTEGGRSAAFTYNGDGERVKMNVADGTTSVLSRYYIGNQYELDITPNGVTERLYLGGDVYSAPAVYVREGNGEWTFYNIGRDYLGNITHIATKDGTLVEENSYDPWGRQRNSETLEIYAPGTEPELMLGRGYTSHEHLTWFGLINMNARLYDPVLGRFLSPDPYVQMPDFTQNFNRYAYCLNNPLIFADETGEFFVLDSFLVGLFGGGWKRAVQMAKNDLRIWGGLFVTDPNKSFWGRVGELVSRFTWQLPQTVFGFLTAHAFNTCRLFKGVENVKYLAGTTVVNTYGDGADLGFVGVTQGSFIVGDNELKADFANSVFQHEYGHYIQSQKFGLLYYGKFGIPSLFSKNTADSPHYKNPVEQDANIRSLKYMHRYGMESLWNEKENKILGYNKERGYNDPDNQSALKNLIKLNWYDFFDPIVISGIVNTCTLNSKY